jgi:NADPH-dependent 2,4-dienoyl-CoA reductase/sulfur reductase-like enzyme
VLAEVSAAADDSGDIVVTYRAAQRSCTGNDSTYFTSGPNDLQAVVDPLAEIRMVLPGVAGDDNLLDPIDLPDAMSNPSYRYFGLTFSPTGTIIAMLQYAYP